MSPTYITHLILEYRYWILIPLSFIEGPIIAFIAGTLASLGLFDLPFLAALFFVRDVGLDGVYYAIGYFGSRTKFSERMLTRIGVTEEHLDQVRALWAKRPGMTMFIGKLSYGIASAFIVAAGVIKMPLRVFFKYGVVIAILEYGTLLLLGYFLGTSLGGSAARLINDIQYAIAAFTIIITGYYLLSWYLRGKLLEEDKEAMEEKPSL